MFSSLKMFLFDYMSSRATAAVDEIDVKKKESSNLLKQLVQLHPRKKISEASKRRGSVRIVKDLAANWFMCFPTKSSEDKHLSILPIIDPEEYRFPGNTFGKSSVFFNGAKQKKDSLSLDYISHMRQNYKRISDGDSLDEMKSLLNNQQNLLQDLLKEDFSDLDDEEISC